MAKHVTLIPADEVLRAELDADPVLRMEWERLQPARDLAHWVLAYRAEHDLSQTQFGRLVDMQQPAVARLELGEHNPTLDTLARLAHLLNTSFHVEVTPERLSLAG